MRLKINGVLCVLGVPRLRFTAARQALRCNLFIISLSLLDKKGFPLQSFTRKQLLGNKSILILYMIIIIYLIINKV
jgi:hypothetical protein